ncbi:MAG: heme exporter protein [Thermoplasmata archaeon]|jgi:heme exporter protein C|nr:heme exporter protein [Thermoplasmata archaeon]
MARAWLPWLAGAAILLDIILTLLVAPEAALQARLTQRIFYYHVPSAWVAYLAFAVTAAAGFQHLRTRSPRADALALASAEVGTVFSLIAMATGLVWSRQAFLHYDAIRDPKVISLAVVILAYLAYFALRNAIDDPARRRRVAAVYGILALIGVPLSYLASQASVHPDFTRPDESLDPRLGVYLLYSTLAFTILYAALADARHHLALVEQRLEESPSTT